ncbi:MAG: exo-alpha-sialidase, partial [Candidatus Aminicenantes bacterium]
MSKRRVIFLILFAIALLAMAGISINSQNRAKILNNGQSLVAGRNVNMTSSKAWPDPDGDVYLQRQNEPSIAVSTLNPLHLLAGANDYRSVDTWESVGELPGIPEEATAGDAWLGAFTSYDGGESWKSKLLPGYITDSAPEFGDSLKGFNAASDPTVRAGIDGLFYYSGIAFDRIRKGASVIFVARYKDYNDTESGDSIRYIDTQIIDEGTSGQFADKPWMAVDIPRNGHPDGLVYLVYSVFLGDITQTTHNKILFARSPDGGDTWEGPIKLSESHQINQGTTVAIDPKNGYVYVAWRQFAKNNNPDAILVARSTDHGRTFTKAIDVSIIDHPFDQPTYDTESGTIQFRTNAFPTIAVDNNNEVYIAWTQREDEDGPARIVIESSIGGLDWSSLPIKVEDSAGLEGHQFMPSLTFAAGKLMIAWYDSRDSVRLKKGGSTEKWITDYYLGEDACPDPSGGNHPCHWRETIDVRI